MPEPASVRTWTSALTVLWTFVLLLEPKVSQNVPRASSTWEK